MDAEHRPGERGHAPDGAPGAAAQASLFQLSFPMFLHSVLTCAVMLLEGVIISAHSADAMAAVAVAKQVLQIAFEMSGMVGIGAVILISHSLGRGEREHARRVAAAALKANAVLGLAIGVLLLLLRPVVLWLLDVPEALADDASTYLAIVAGSMFFNGIAAAALSCLRAFGKSRIILRVGLALSVLYVATLYVLVLGAGPVPPLGVMGAALGAFFLRVLMAVLFGLALFVELGPWSGGRPLLSQLPLVRKMLGLAYPSVSDYIGYSFYQLALLSLVTGFGVAAVLGRAYVLLAMSFLVLVVMAISQGNEVLLGYRCGERRREQAFHQALRSSVIAATLTTVLAALVWLLADPFIGLFRATDEIRAQAERLLLLTIFLQPGLAFNTILLQSLRAVGDVRWPVVASVAITWGAGLPLAWLLCVRLDLGVEGVWYALIVEETAKAVIMLLRWTHRGWLRHGLV
ncbi:MATE family efflux transporter [Xanthobacter sp. ZOL 2024]